MIRTYEQQLRSNIIENYIRDNNRSPTVLEVDELYREQSQQYPLLESVGFSGISIVKPSYASISSATDENLNTKSILQDLQLGFNRLSYISLLLESSYRGFNSVATDMKSKLRKIESRLDNLLLLSGSTDVFVYGMEETFDTQEFIDFEQTTATVDSGFCTLGKDALTSIDLSKSKITYGVNTDKGYYSSSTNSTIDTLKENDGKAWEYYVYTSYTQGKVSVYIDIDIRSTNQSYVSQVYLSGVSTGLSGQVYGTCFYSTDGKIFKAIQPEELAITTGSQIFDIGIDNIKKVRIMLTKYYSDTSTDSNQNVYTFSIDRISLYQGDYITDAESVVMAGPYTIVDELGSPLYFSKATCDVCCTQGEDRAVSAYLSTNGIDWKSCDHQNVGANVVTFTGTSSESVSYLYFDQEANVLIDDIDHLLFDSQCDAFLNACVDTPYQSQFVLKSVVVKRGTVGEANSDDGWEYDKNRQMYKTTVYVSNPEGIQIDLGATSAYINGNQVTGIVQLLYGYSVFETAEANWYQVSSGVLDLASLRKLDPLYPYNHKYIIEGYPYAELFNGEKTYIGVPEYFGTLVQYVPEEEFEKETNAQNYGIYTIDESTSRTIFKIKVNKQISTWRDELATVEWSLSGEEYNTIYFKLVLRSQDNKVSPIVTGVKIRVI